MEGKRCLHWGPEGVGKAGAQQDRAGQGEGDGQRQAESLTGDAGQTGL